MALPLYDPKACYEDLQVHIGHKIVVVGYGDANDPINIAVECETCGVVLLDYNNPNMEE